MNDRLEELERRLAEVEAEARLSGEAAAACRAELRAARRRGWLTSTMGLCALVVGLTVASPRADSAFGPTVTPLTITNPQTRQPAFRFTGNRSGNELQIFNPRGQRLMTLGASNAGGQVLVFDSPGVPLALLGRRDDGQPGGAVMRGLTLYQGGAEVMFLGSEMQDSLGLNQRWLRISTALDDKMSTYLGTVMVNGVGDTRGLGVVTADGTSVECGSHDPEHTRGFNIRQNATGNNIAGMFMQRDAAGRDFGQVYTRVDGDPPVTLFYTPAP